jgi:hypothetical protein
MSTLIQEAIAATNPSIRHLASHSSLGSQHSHTSSTNPRSPYNKAFRPLSTTFEEQRHTGKPPLGLSKNTRVYEPGDGHGVYDSDELNLFDRSTRSFSSKEHEAYTYGSSRADKAPSPKTTSEKAASVSRRSSKTFKESQHGNEVYDETEEDDSIYPSLLGLFILISGIALSVFLISLDRTIITTVSCSVAQSEMKSIADCKKRQSHTSRMSSNHTTISDGMALHTSSQHRHFSLYMVASSCS